MTPSTQVCPLVVYEDGERIAIGEVQVFENGQIEPLVLTDRAKEVIAEHGLVPSSYVMEGIDVWVAFSSPNSLDLDMKVFKGQLKRNED